ncbi:mechanosensitive cation channel TMEM63A-like [Rhinoraja longicauda]
MASTPALNATVSTSVPPSTFETTPTTTLADQEEVTMFNGTDCFNPLGEPVTHQRSSFGGIPTVLLIYFILFWILIFMFSLLRKKAWDYGRIAFFSDYDSHYEDEANTSRQNTSIDQQLMNDRGYSSWLVNTFSMMDSELREQCGDDAIVYLSFQRHLIAILIVMSIMSVGIILPVNISGSLLIKDPEHFGRTTIANIKIKNDILWFHTVFAVVYMLLTVLVLRHHASSTRYTEDDVVKRTLLIARIPKKANEEDIGQHLREAYPTCTVLEVELCYDVELLMKLNAERMTAGHSRDHYSKLVQDSGRRAFINPKPCGHFCCCSFRGCEQVDAMDYYTRLENELQEQFMQQRDTPIRKSLGIAFATFQDESMATLVLKDLSRIQCRGCRFLGKRQPSSHCQSLQVSKWVASYAPSHQNIHWTNLSLQGAHWWLRCIVINFMVIILLFFLTTPSIMLSTIDSLNITRPIYHLNDPVINQFLPTLLLWTFSALLPTIVRYSTVIVRHWTRSAENRFIMHKVYTYLTIMVLILPSLGLTSLDVFFRWLFDKKFLDKAKIKFECLKGQVTQQEAYPFEFGLNYAWVLCIFTVVTAYSITCPVIVPFGLIYLLLRHMVDRYNLYYAYLPTQLSQRLHMAAVKQAATAPIICLLWLLFFSIIRGGLTAPTSIFTLSVVLLTIVVCIVMGFADKKYFTIDKVLKLTPEASEVEQTAQRWDTRIFTPKVLRLSKGEKNILDPQRHPSYGAVGDSSQLLVEETVDDIPPDDIPSLDNADGDQIHLVDDADG